MSDTIAACEAAAHERGLAPALELALREAGPGVPSGRIGALPAAAVPAGAAVLPHRLAEREGVRFVRLPLPAPGPQPPAAAPPADPAPSSDAAPAGPPADAVSAEVPSSAASFGALLGAVRIGLARRLLDDAVAHLSGRTSGGEPLTRKQLVLGTVADVHTGLAAVRELLRVAGGSPAAVADAHERLTALDWEAAKLLGAAGFLADGPARAGYVGWLVAASWLDGDASPAVPGRPVPQEARP